MGEAESDPASLGLCSDKWPEQPIPNNRIYAWSIVGNVYGNAIAAAGGDNDTMKILPSLIGKLSEAAIVDASWTARKDAAVHRRRRLKVGAGVDTA